VDERKHIFRASEAAAQYFHKANYDFDNWVYAVIAYYEGLTGAVRFTDPAYYGKMKMIVTDELHWYVMKAIAHKIAYETALSMGRSPRVWLAPHLSDDATPVQALCQQHNISQELFIEYNQWVTNGQILPGEVFTYYIPHFSEPYPGHIPDPAKSRQGLAKPTLPQLPAEEAIGQTPSRIETPDLPSKSQVIAQLDSQRRAEEQNIREQAYAQEEAPQVSEVVSVDPETEPVLEKPVPKKKKTQAARNRPIPRGAALEVTAQPDLDYASFYLYADLDYGQTYVMYDGELSLGQIARRYEVPLGKLAFWNGIRGGKSPEKGSILYLDKPKKVDYHVVEAGETLNQVAALHNTSARKIQKKNRMEKRDRTIYVGQKLYLKSKKPKGEKIIILTPENPLEPKPEKVDIPVQGQEKKESLQATAQTEQGASPKVETKPVENPKEPAQEPQASSAEAKQATQQAPPPPDFTGPKTRWIEHTVSPGETLWSISVTYGTKVEIIKLINNLKNDSLSTGMVLRILAKEEKLKELGID
jgi:LysM repeat protein